MVNLLKETLEVLEKHGLTIDDIEWIGSEDFKIANFFDIASIKYDDGFGAQEIPFDLVIVGKDWWLERYEYDGSEQWEFKKKPTEPLREKTLKTIPLGMWDSLYDLVSDFERKEEQESEEE